MRNKKIKLPAVAVLSTMALFSFYGSAQATTISNSQLGTLSIKASGAAVTLQNTTTDTIQVNAAATITANGTSHVNHVTLSAPATLNADGSAFTNAAIDINTNQATINAPVTPGNVTLKLSGITLGGSQATAIAVGAKKDPGVTPPNVNQTGVNPVDVKDATAVATKIRNVYNALTPDQQSMAKGARAFLQSKIPTSSNDTNNTQWWKTTFGLDNFFTQAKLRGVDTPEAAQFVSSILQSTYGLDADNITTMQNDPTLKATFKKLFGNDVTSSTFYSFLNQMETNVLSRQSDLMKAYLNAQGDRLASINPILQQAAEATLNQTQPVDFTSLKGKLGAIGLSVNQLLGTDVPNLNSQTFNYVNTTTTAPSTATFHDLNQALFVAAASQLLK